LHIFRSGDDIACGNDACWVPTTSDKIRSISNLDFLGITTDPWTSEEVTLQKLRTNLVRHFLAWKKLPFIL
jgi:hypothetical protein